MTTAIARHSAFAPVGSVAAPTAPVGPTALSPPAATISTTKILKFRSFSLCVEMGAVFARRFSEFDVMRAGLNAKVRREDDPSRNIGACFCSAGKKIVEVGISTKASFGPTISADGQKVTYTFDNCKSNCSSSRDHHKSKLILVIDDLPGTDPVYTTPFALQAREKQRPSRMSKGLNEPHAMLAELQPVVEDSPPSGPTEVGELVTRGARELDLSATGSSVIAAQRDPVAHLPPLIGGITVEYPRLMVRVHTVGVAPNEADDVLGHFACSIRGLPGYCDYKWKTHPGFIITFSTFQSVDGAVSSLDVAKRFIQNDEKYPNPYHCDLTVNSICQLVSYCTSW